ncbi:uncharacterized protein VTP21DRAFT_877 [Calcarisporiella thermophila]|uniref:uncharacterized protein n=1 Tax=Calcarisporiella thermophila TaxID=911321 RepID=UPI003743E373
MQKMRTPIVRFATPFLQNKFLEPSSSPRPLIHPATGQPWAHVTDATPALVDESVKHARAALATTWGLHSTAAQRRDILLQAAAKIREHAAELAELEAHNAGKPLGDARDDVEYVAGCFQYFAEQAGWLEQTSEGAEVSLSGGKRGYTVKEPAGVCAQILSFNYPLSLAAWKVAPALATGNCIILKPAAQTPLTALYLAHLFTLAPHPLPPGVLSVLPGGADVGRALAEHPDVDRISFTGSTAVGRAILRSSADSNLKRPTLELGGKSAMIVTEETDPVEVAREVVGACFTNTGQNCCAGTRLLVQRGAFDRVLAAVQDEMRRIRVVGPEEESEEERRREGLRIGPLIDEAQFARVQRFLDTARAEGDEILVGGGPVAREGYFVHPTLIRVRSDESTVAREEVFGPVLSVLPAFDTLDEAIDRANASPFGLGAGVFTRDRAQAAYLVPRLQAGTVWVNCYNYTPVGLPFGGYKQSGFGKDLGPECLHEYVNVKSIMTNF